MRIAICDDENNCINVVEDYLDKVKGENLNITCDAYYSGESLVEAYKNAEDNPYDLIFLDMEMSGMNGIDTAKEIRKLDRDVLIVYVTSHSAYVYECFDANPLRFLVKPVDFDKFRETFETAYSRYANSNKLLTFTSNRNKLMLYCNEIVYFESSRRKMIIHTIGGESYDVYSTVKEITELVKSSPFAFPHNSFIINMKHIDFVDAETLTMCDGTEVPISKKFRKDFLNAYLAFTERSYR